jgi:hypothetical protein
MRGAWDESGTSADGDACRRFFRTDPRVMFRGSAAACPRLARTDHAGEVENRAAGVPIRVRRVSPLTQRPIRMPTLISARRTANPSERGHRQARAGGVVFRP